MKDVYTDRPLVRGVCIAIILLLIDATTMGPSFAQRVAAPPQIQVEPLIKKIKLEKDPYSRTKLASQLAGLVMRSSPNDISTEDIRKLTLLLENDDDSVRYFAAAALGHLGSRAIGSVPALKRALEKSKCRTEQKNSEQTIVPALQQIEGRRPIVRCN